jgi:FAD-dependent oxidoreductase domain-containing protein 1
VSLLDPVQLGQRFPWLSTAGLTEGSLGLSGEGWFDGYSLLQAFRKKARSLGARYLEAEACGFESAESRIRRVRLSNGEAVDCDVAINAAGPWARLPAAWLGIEVPVRARRRCVFVFNCPTKIDNAPLVIDPSGVYFRPEGQGFICGVSPDAATDADDLPLDVDHALFDDVIWPCLASRVPAFESLRQTSAWAGYYEYNTFDCNGIVGFHPDVPNFLLANGFSGHGLQHSPGIGRAMAELVVHGSYRTLDLSALAFSRIPANQPIRELNVV